MGAVVQSQESSAFLSFKVCGSTDIPKGSKVKLVSLVAFSVVSTWLATFIRSEPPVLPTTHSVSLPFPNFPDDTLCCHQVVPQGSAKAPLGKVLA